VISVLKQLTEVRGFTAALVLTYNVDLAWFERLHLRRLKMRGLRHMLVFADHNRLSECLNAQLPLLRSAGKSYVVQGIDAGRSFHPKALLLAGPNAARLYVGSGNLTRSGYGRNLEIVEQWETGVGDKVLPAVFDGFREYVESLYGRFVLEPADARTIRNLLDAIFGVGGLQKPVAPLPSTPLWGSPDGALLNRLSRPTSPASMLQIVAPFFDDDGTMPAELAARLGAKEFEVLTDPRTTNLTSGAATAIGKAGGRVFAIRGQRPLHGKLLYASGADWQFAVTGSANATNAAWRGFNAELVAVRRNGDAEPIRKLLQQVQRSDITSEEWRCLDERAEQRKLLEKARNSSQGHQARIVAARWIDGQRLLVVVNAPAATPLCIQVRAEDISCIATHQLRGPVGQNREMEVHCPASIHRCPAMPVAVRALVGDVPGPWTLVLDLAELHESAQERSRPQEYLNDLLDSPDDPEAEERFLVLFANILQQRMAQRREAADSKVANADGVQPAGDEAEKPMLVKVHEEQEEAPAFSQDARAKAHPTLGHFPRYLTDRLLFGDLVADDADEREGESEASEDLTELAPRDENLPSHHLATRAARPTLYEAAGRARGAYLDELQASDDVRRDAPRLLEDLEVLVAVAHYALARGHITALGFVEQMVPVLDAFLGGPFAPLPRMLGALQGDERDEAWSRVPFLVLAGLLVYNTCLAHEQIAQSDSDNDALADLQAENPVLWMRHLVRHAPADQIDRARSEMGREMPRIRRGVFWIADRIAEIRPAISFPDFMALVIGDASALERACPQLKDQVLRHSGIGKPNDEDGLVIGLVSGEVVTAGFYEVITSRRIDVWLKGGAFQRPDLPGTPYLGMTRDPSKSAPLAVIEKECADLPEHVHEGLEVLRKIAST
jgi:hypothetical protein